MENNIRKTGLNNVKETWENNERQQREGREGGEVPAASELDRMVREEAAEYDEASSEDRLLGGDRASVRDEE